jgi:replication-associated recombination protein RarA
MKLSEKYRPATLEGVVGQSATRYLRSLGEEPDERCVLLEGVGGCGKTSAALALAAELGCRDEFSGLHIVPCSEFSIDVARRLFEGADGYSAVLRLRPLEGRGWHVVVLEELEWLSPQCQRYLKVALETRMPLRTIVVATSNGAGGLDRALLQRFDVFAFGSGKYFAQACQERLEAIWLAEASGQPMPPDWLSWGWDGEHFSMRSALAAMELCLRTSGREAA